LTDDYYTTTAQAIYVENTYRKIGDPLSMTKSEPSRNPSYAFYDFEAPEIIKSTARWGGGLFTCLRNRRIH